MIKEISSSANKYYKKFLSIKKGVDKIERLILVEGYDLIELAQLHNQLRSLILLQPDARYEEYDQYILSKELYRELSSYKSLPQAIGVCSLELTTVFPGKVIYLDDIQDPGNLGTIIRTASAFNYDAVALSKGTVSPYNSKAVQASKGAIFNIPVGYAELSTLTDKKIYFTVLDGEVIEEKVHNDGDFVLVFGNEGRGIRKELLTLPGEKVKLEMANIDSLNVAIAASIFMFLFKE